MTTIKQSIKNFFDEDVADIAIDALGIISLVACSVGLVFGIGIVTIAVVQVLVQ